MPLSTTDLSAIGKIVDRSFDVKIKPLSGKMVNLDKKIVNLDQKFDMKIAKIDRKFDKLFNFLDKDFSKTKREVREIQEYLDLPVAEF